MHLARNTLPARGLDILFGHTLWHHGFCDVLSPIDPILTDSPRDACILEGVIDVSVRLHDVKDRIECFRGIGFRIPANGIIRLIVDGNPVAEPGISRLTPFVGW